VKKLYNEKYFIMKEIEENQKCGVTYYVHELEESLLLRCAYYPE
jgi:hypothetical protein